MDNYKISYRTLDDGHFTGLWAVPGDPHWRPCANPFGAEGGVSKFQTAGEAIADAGFRLVGFLNHTKAQALQGH